MSDKCYECESELSVVCMNCNTHAVPAATDTGLVTVGWLWEYAQYRTDERGYYGYETVITENNPMDHISPAEKLRNIRELVTRDQAAAIIAAKDGRIMDYKNLVDALHAKLAQYEAQEAIGYISEYGLNKLESRAFHQMVDVRKSIEGDHTIPLYASPAPAVDLKAENE